MLAAGPVAFRPPGIRFLGILSRRGLVPLLRSAYPSLMGSDPDGVSTFRAYEMRPGWAPLYPEASGVHTTSESIPVAACRLHQRPGPTTRVFVPSFRALRYEASQGVYLRSPVRSSPRPVAPRTEQGPLGFSLELRTPSRQDPSGARRGGD